MPRVGEWLALEGDNNIAMNHVVLHPGSRRPLTRPCQHVIFHMTANPDKPIVTKVGNVVLTRLVLNRRAEVGCDANGAVIVQLFTVVASEGGIPFAFDSHCKGRQYREGTDIFEQTSLTF
jgi:hypothetical protein